MNRDKTRKHKIVLLIVLGIFFSLLAYIYPPVFETNDDRTMGQIISGMQGHALSIRRGRRSIQSFLRHRPEDQVRRFYVILYSFYTSRDHPGYPE